MDIKKLVNTALCKPEKGDKVEYFNMKGRVSANVLVTSQQNMPTCSYTYEADLTKFLDEFGALKKNCDYKLSFNTLMMRVLVEGLKVSPRLNSHIQYNHFTACGKLIVKEHINVAMPVVMDSGETFTVNVTEIENKSLKELSEQIANLLDKVQNSDIDRSLFDLLTLRMFGRIFMGKVASTISQIATAYVGKYKVVALNTAFKPHKDNDLTIDELNEGTVCLTNWGALAKGECFNGHVPYSPLLHPQVFLMSLGNIQEQNYVFRNEKGEIDMGTKKILPITLLFDHRVGGFADIAPFVLKLDEIFSNPEIIKEW